MSALPSVIGRYKIVRQLGQGGMGRVLLAWDPMLERQVTVKLLRDVDSAELRTRFTREARSAARLRHPNIVTVFDVGEDNEQPFIAMEYIHGQTVDEIIKRNVPLTLARQVYLIEQVCAGLAYAHRAGIVHRDVKPANLMVDQDGVLKVLDFGIVHVVGSATTHSGRLMGTLNYVSPEQLTGRPIDQRADIFALGAVFYELLTHKQAFPGSIRDGLFQRIVNDPPEPLSELRPDLPAEIVSVVMRALEKNPDARYPDVVTMRADLQHIRRSLSSDEPSEAVPLPGDPAQIDDDRARAERALAAGDFERAIEASEDVLMRRPDDSGAALMLDQARVALDRRQADQWLDEAGALLDHDDLTDASALIDQALTIAPGSTRALRLRAEVEAAREAPRVKPAPAAVIEAPPRAQPRLVVPIVLAAIAIAAAILYLQTRNTPIAEPQAVAPPSAVAEPPPAAPADPLPAPPPQTRGVDPKLAQREPAKTPRPEEQQATRPAPLPEPLPQRAPPVTTTPAEPAATLPVAPPPAVSTPPPPAPPPIPEVSAPIPAPPVAPAPAVEPAARPPAAAPKPAVDEEAAVRATLRAYERAYSSLDAAAVKRLQPAVDVNALSRAFEQLREQSVVIRNERIAVSGNTATVSATVIQSFTPRVGSRGETSVSAVFRLQKAGDSWVIAERK